MHAVLCSVARTGQVLPAEADPPLQSHLTCLISSLTALVPDIHF